MTTTRTLLTGLLATLFAAASALPALADPPPWAPAHGYRAKHDGGFGKGRGKHGKHRGDHYEDAYVVPFGIATGRCNREEIGAILGGALGGYAGSEIAKGDGRIAAIVGGTLLGAVVGGQIGRSMDEADRHCVGQALEYAEDGRSVAWHDPDSGTRYGVTPVRTYESGGGRYCRDYRTEAVIGGREQAVLGTACRQPDGSWQRID